MPSWSSEAQRTRRPVALISAGSLVSACCTRFCTFMSATSRSVPTSNVMPSEYEPSSAHDDDMNSMSSTPFISSSSGEATVFITSCAFAPG